jgi:hypothetical protein
MKTIANSTINDDQRLVSALSKWGVKIPIYDDGFGPLYVHRDSMGISGIVRAQTWEDAYSICEDEFFPTAHFATEKLYSEMTEHEQACWDESYGHRPNGIGGPTPRRDCGIYAKDLNGDRLDLLTPELLEMLEITLVIESEI